MNVVEDGRGNVYEVDAQGNVIRQLASNGRKPQQQVSLDSINPVLKEGIKEGVSTLIGESGAASAVPGGVATAVPGAIPGAGQSVVDGVIVDTPLANAPVAGGIGLGQVLGAAGAAYGGYNMLKNFGKYDSKSGAMRGAATGASLGSIIPGVGTIIGGIGGAAVGALAGAFKHKTTAEYKAERAKELMGLNSPGVSGYLQQASRNAPGSPNYLGAIDPNAGADFVGINSKNKNQWTNNKFAASGDEKDLQAQDVWGSYGMMKTFGGDYLDKMSEYQRYAASRAAVENNLINADKGDLLVTDGDKLKELATAGYETKQWQQDYNDWTNSTPQPGTVAAPAPTGGVGLSSVRPNAAEEERRKAALLGIATQGGRSAPARQSQIGSVLTQSR
jgi:hypothetical protein